MVWTVRVITQRALANIDQSWENWGPQVRQKWKVVLLVFDAATSSFVSNLCVAAAIFQFIFGVACMLIFFRLIFADTCCLCAFCFRSVSFLPVCLRSVS